MEDEINLYSTAATTKRDLLKLKFRKYDERQKRKREKDGWKGRRESQKGKEEKRKSIKWALSISIVDCCECKRKGEIGK